MFNKGKIMKFKKIMLLANCIFFGNLAFADGFPLASGSPTSTEQPMVLQPQNSIIVSNNVNNSVPPLTNNSSMNNGTNIMNNSQQNIVNGGKNIATGTMQDSFATGSASDQLTQDINNLKKQKQIQELQSKLKSSNGVQYQNTSQIPSIANPNDTPVVVKKPITATMIDYVIAKNGKAFATIQFMDKSTVEVEKNSLVNGYKVSSIKVDHITLNKVDKSLSGDSVVKLYKSFPVVLSTTSNFTYGNVAQSVTMDDSFNLKK